MSVSGTFSLVMSRGSPSKQFVHEGPTDYHCKLQRKERVALEKHAQEAGFSLIINPDKSYAQFTASAVATRMQTLMEFLRSFDRASVPVTVAFNGQMEDESNTTIVGDWFAAELVSMKGPQQTNFTTHATSIQTRIGLFDAELKELLEKENIEPEKSRDWAIEQLQKRIDKVARKSTSLASPTESSGTWFDGAVISQSARARADRNCLIAVSRGFRSFASFAR